MVFVPVNSQMVGIKSQVNKNYSIQFSIKSNTSKMLLLCRKIHMKWPNMNQAFFFNSNQKIHLTQNAMLMAIYFRQEIVYDSY